jgi:hypothetical protein
LDPLCIEIREMVERAYILLLLKRKDRGKIRWLEGRPWVDQVEVAAEMCSPPGPDIQMIDDAG